MDKKTENAIVDAIGELGVKLDDLGVKLDDLRVNLSGKLDKVEKSTSNLNHKFDRMFGLLKENLDLKNRVERLERKVFK